jgi:CubicO group peptidase (beta-lactamase class C family)
MKFTTNLLLFILLLFDGCKQTSHDASMSAEAKSIDSYLQDLVDRQQIPGLTVAATRNDSVVYTGAFGHRNIETKESMKAGCDFHWASVSKTFVATSIMQLVEKGKLNLDEKLITYLPYFKQKDDDYKFITIRQMLNHTSGIGDVEDYEWDRPQNDDGAPERFVRSLENDKMLFKPGTDWSYSNTAYEILGVLITTVSGMPFESYVKENLFGPLEMIHSSFIYPEIPDSLRVSGHLWAGKPIVSKIYPYNKIHAPSSTLNSNVLEMTHYAIANLHRGKYKDVQILNDSSYNLLWTNSVNLKDKPAVGASWFLDEYRGLKTMSHGGGDTGFRSFLLLVPEKDISVMVACNYELCRTGDIAHAVLDMLIGEDPEELKRQIGFSFAEVLLQDGVKAAKDFYKTTYEDSTTHKYYFWKETDGALVRPGYALLDQKMFNEALEVFRFNVETNPNSGWAYGHLGVAYARAGNEDLARENLGKAIKIIPTEEYFREQLKKLDEKKK